MKIKLKNRNFTKDGSIVYSPESLVKSLFVDPKIIEGVSYIYKQDIISNVYDSWAKIYDLPTLNTSEHQIDHTQNQLIWLMSEKYNNIDIEQYVLSLCKTQKEIDRVTYELNEFKDRDLFNLLKYMVYLRDIVKENNIVLGIGRGSSVSSYILYLLEIHKVDSIKYNLDIKEFLK